MELDLEQIGLLTLEELKQLYAPHKCHMAVYGDRNFHKYIRVAYQVMLNAIDGYEVDIQVVDGKVGQFYISQIQPQVFLAPYNPMMRIRNQR